MSELAPALVRIRDKYPASKCVKDDWATIKKMVADGNEKEAEAFAKQCLVGNRKLTVRNKIAIAHRVIRREYLAFQRDIEAETKTIFQTLGDKIASILIDASDSDGKIPIPKTKPILDRITSLNKGAHAEFKNLLANGVRQSVRWGIFITMKSAQAGLEYARKTKESESAPGIDDYDGRTEILFSLNYIREEAGGITADLIEQETVPSGMWSDLGVTSLSFKKIFDRVKKRRLEKGLFVSKDKTKRSPASTGLTLSQRIWDMRADNLRRLRNEVASGIAQGKSAAVMASNVKGMTWKSEIGKAAPAGPGIYKTAFKNALRLTRTETNMAYVDAQAEYTKFKGYQIMWNVSIGSRNSDECDDYGGNLYDPDEIATLYPPHPNCGCFMTTVIPGIG